MYMNILLEKNMNKNLFIDKILITELRIKLMKKNLQI